MRPAGAFGSEAVTFPTMNREVLFTADAPGAIGPYSQAIRAQGGLVFLSGQIALRPDGTLVEGDVKAQAEQVLSNLQAVLAGAGLTPANVVKTTIFLSSMEHFSAVNEVYGRVFSSEPPARSTVAVAGLPRGVDVEIEAVAVY
jgi:2-iminobutanoate/2-iminopropanoate deaminase